MFSHLLSAVAPLATAAGAAVAATASAVSAAVVAAGYKEWSTGEWAIIIAGTTTFAVTVIGAIFAGMDKLVRTIRGEAEKTREKVAENTAITEKAASAAEQNPADVAEQIQRMLAGVPQQVDKAVREAVEHKLKGLEQRKIWQEEAAKIHDTNETVHRVEDRIGKAPESQQ